MKLKELFESEERSILSVMGKQPEHVDSHFFCAHNKLTSLVGAPSSVADFFSCDYNKLTSLVGAPSSVGGNFFCDNNKLTSLAGAPSLVGGNFFCHNNKLTSLHGIHQIIKEINGGEGDFTGNPIKSHVLGLLRIKGLTEVALSDEKVEKIVNKHLAGDRDIFACQEELIEAGYPEMAKL